MEDNEILKKLRENNPFLSAASPSPWENKSPDLLQLSRDVSENIEQLMLYKRREPSTPLAGFVLGEAGSGKTHMLTRILRRLRRHDILAVFVSVRAPHESETDTITRHLLNEIFISLKQIHSPRHSKTRTQFDLIMSEFIDRYKERRRQDGYSEAEILALDIRSQVAKDIPGLKNKFLKCFIKYISTGDATIRNDLLDWLSDGLDHEDSMRLGLSERDLDSLDDSHREHEAEEVLIALGHILAYAKVSMIVCFDQLDGMTDRNLISAWGNIIHLLVNDLSGILPLCFIRSQNWNDVFVPILNDAVIQRLRNNTMIMKPCSLAQARLLIKMKIETNFKDDSEEIFNWLIARMGSKLRDGYSPRLVIELANRAISDDEAPAAAPINPPDENLEIIKQIKEAYEDEYKKVQNEPGVWPPDTENLMLALEVWLKSFEGLEITKSDIKDMKLNGKYHGHEFTFIVVICKMHFVASAGLKRASDFLAEHPDEFCCYVSEKKIHKPSWKKVIEAMNRFKNAGGHVLMLDDESRVQWYALTSLINRIDNGDVNLYLPSGNRIADRRDLIKFAPRIELVDLSFFDVPDNNGVKETLSSLLNVSPMKMLNTVKAAELLSQNGIEITEEKLISLLKHDQSKRFEFFETDSNAAIITLKEAAGD